MEVCENASFHSPEYMKTCLKCNKEFTISQKFCIDCNSTIVPETSSYIKNKILWTCHTCNKIVAAISTVDEKHAYVLCKFYFTRIIYKKQIMNTFEKDRGLYGKKG